jgi:HEAT repeat protein
MHWWCFHCYGINEKAAGACRHCDQAIEEPENLSRVERLIWTLGHPDADRALLAAQVLGTLKDAAAVPALRTVVEASTDPYLAAEALQSLIAIEGVEAFRSWLERLLTEAPIAVRRVAGRALNGSGSQPHQR